METLDTLTAERERIESECRRLEGIQETLEKKQAELIRMTEDSAGDMGTLSQLEIETEQVIEAKRLNDRMFAQATTRLVEVEKVIAMQRQSDMV